MLRLSPITTSQTSVRRSFRRIAHLDTALPADLADTLWRDPASLIDRGEQLRRSNARRTVSFSWHGQTYVLKHSTEPTFRHAVKQLVLPSRAWNTWTFSHRLADAGVATPRPVACVENVFGQFRLDSYLMYPYVEGRTLRSLFQREAQMWPEVQARLWRQIDALWQQLLALNVSLSDANVGNFIVAADGQLWLIDLDKSRFHKTARAAAPYQERAWNKLLRCANRYGARPPGNTIATAARRAA